MRPLQRTCRMHILPANLQIHPSYTCGCPFGQPLFLCLLACTKKACGMRQCILQAFPVSCLSYSCYTRSLALRAVFPDFSQTAICFSLPFSNTDRILITPPHRLVNCFEPSRRAFFDNFPDICYSSIYSNIDFCTITIFSALVKGFLAFHPKIP